MQEVYEMSNEEMIKLLVAVATDIFDTISDTMYGDYEVGATDSNNREITIKVTIKEGEEDES